MDRQDQKILELGSAAISGVALSGLMTSTGLSVALHEVVGHGYLGFRLVNHYPPGMGPSYQVDGYDNFKEVLASKTLVEEIKNTGLWLSGYDRNHDGAAGYCVGGGGHSNALGLAMGYHGKNAWISLSGSLPGLGMDSLMVASAFQIRHSHPKLAALMGSYAICDHFINSAYPFTAAIMKVSELERVAAKGHDFANFAIHISAMTGVSAIVVARVTLIAWVAFVPLVALISYLHSQAQRDSLFSDEAAIAYLMHFWKTDSDLKNIIDKFKNRDVVERKECSAEDLIKQFDLGLVKEKMLKQVLAFAELDDVEKRLSHLSTIASVMGWMGKLVGVFAQGVYPSLKPLARGFAIAFPFTQCVSAFQAVYRTKKDLSAKEEENSQAIKAFSIAVAASVVLTSFGQVASSFLIKAKWVLPASFVGSLTLPVGFSYLRAQAIRKKINNTAQRPCK